MANLKDAQGIELKVGDPVVTVKVPYNAITEMDAGYVVEVTNTKVVVLLTRGKRSTFLCAKRIYNDRTTKVLKVKGILEKEL